MSAAPQFSIVIPTRNRGHLLPYALRSALEQDVPDFEVVVVANDCHDDTRSVVESLANERVRYFETDRLLTMPENWDFAWTKARGQYVTYLPDDDALVPSALSLMAEHALTGGPQVVSWEDAPYYYPDWHDAALRNVLLLFFAGDALVEDVASEVYRQQCARFEFAWSSPLPKLLNCIADRAFFDDWRTRVGQLFFPAAPDYSFAWIATHVCSTVRVVHRPLSVRGISDHSIGSNAGLGAASQAFFKEFGDFDVFGDAPTRTPTSLSLLAATFTRINRAFAERGIEHMELDQPALMIALAKQVKDAHGMLANWSEHAAHLTEAGQRISPELGTTVCRILDGTSTADEPPEPIRAVRDRTRHMALEHPLVVPNAVSRHLQDALCARCTLGLENGVLADANWSYLYLFGDEIGASNPHTMSQQVDRYYEVLRGCRDKQERYRQINGEATYDQETDLRLLARILRQLDNKTVMDVGAEHGTFAQAFLEHGATRVLAFEPHPQNAAALRERFSSNRSVRVFELAVGEHDEAVTLYLADDKTGKRNTAYHSLVAFQDTPTLHRSGELRVDCRTLASLVTAGEIPPQVGILKIDAERSDFAILRGMGELQPDVVMIEYWDDLPETVGPAAYQLDRVTEWMRQRQYSNYAVIKRHDEFEIIEFNNSQTRPGDWGNVLFIHDNVFHQLLPSLTEEASAAQIRLLEKAAMFARECRNRAVVIDEQQETIRQLREDASPSAVDQPIQEHLGAPAETETPESLPAVLTRQTDAIRALERRLANVERTYEEARVNLEQSFQGQLALSEKERSTVQDAAEARLAVIREQQHALEAYRYWSLRERVARFKSPRLGVLYQHPPRTLQIPHWYEELQALPQTIPTISIVTPSFNQGTFIERTVRSVLDQNYPTLEYIVQDAGSTDETPEIIERYAASLAHAEMRRDDGFGNGINLGFSHASGDIMAYLNSDDLLLPGTLRYVAAYFAAHPDVDVIYGHRIVVDEYDAEIGRWVLPGHDDSVLSWADYVPQETLFWRRSIWDRAGGAIDEEFRFAIDWDLLLRFRDAGARMRRLPRFLGAFRVHPHQKTSSSMEEVGKAEMARLRERSLGRAVTHTDINKAVGPYLRRHLVYHKLYRLGVLRY